MAKVTYPGDLAEEFRMVNDNLKPIPNPTEKNWEDLMEFFIDNGFWKP